jgi:ankyrin repeat protein
MEGFLMQAATASSRTTPRSTTSPSAIPQRVSGAKQIDDAAKINTQYQYEDNDMLGILAVRLHALHDAAVHMPDYTVGNAAISLEKYLKDEQQKNAGKRTLLIPYNEGGYHWIGLAIKITADDKVEQAVYMDSLPETGRPNRRADIIRDIKAVYPESKVAREIRLIQTDGTSCGLCTIENLMAFARGEKTGKQVLDQKGSRRIRKEHVDIYKAVDKNFQERQWKNINKVASYAERYKWLQNAGTNFRERELQRITDLTADILSITDAAIRREIITILNSDEKTELHGAHLNRIRTHLFALRHRNREQPAIVNLLDVFLAKFFAKETKDIKSAKDFTGYRMALDYEEIKAIRANLQNSKGITSKHARETADAVKKQVAADEALARKLQAALWNEPAKSKRKDDKTSPDDKSKDPMPVDDEDDYKLSSKRPGYVVNIPFRVDSDSDSKSDSSSSESDDENFPDHYFREPFPFKAKIKSQPDSSPPSKEPPTKDSPKTKLHRLTNIFATEAFGSTKEESLSESKGRLTLVVGLNRRESLDKKRNRHLRKLLDTEFKTEIPVSRIGFFWRQRFEEKRSSNGEWKETKFERVRRWYKKLKKIDKQKAEKFRKSQEHDNIRQQIPFRRIRERIKDSDATKQAVRVMRARSHPAEIYLNIADSDTKSLRDGAKGTFTHYDEMVIRHKKRYGQAPIVLSTGYRIREPTKLMLELAVDLDQVVREATAEHIGNGIYHPEPSVGLLILQNKDTITESFLDPKRPNKHDNESKQIISNITRARDIKTLDAIDKSFAFQAQGAVVTGTPTRFIQTRVSRSTKQSSDSLKKEKENTKQFCGFPNKENKIILWTQKDFVQIRGTPQSHINNLKWAHNISDALPDRAPTAFNSTLQNGTFNQMLASVISTLFNCFDPLYIAKMELQKNGTIDAKNNYVNCLAKVIEEYEAYIPYESADEKTRAGNHDAWAKLDSALSPGKKIKRINQLTGHPEWSQRILLAAQASGLAIKKMLAEKLCLDFTAVIQGQLEFYLNELDEKGELAVSASRDDTELHDAILHNTLPVIEEKFPRKYRGYVHNQGRYHLTPLHWAAVTGNTRATKLLKKQEAKLDMESFGGVLPLHLALKFCEWHGNNPRLVAELANKKAVNHRTADGATPLLMALILLEIPFPIAEILIKKGANVNKRIPLTGEYSCFIEEKREQCGTWPIFEAIKLKNKPLILLLINKGAKLTGIYNEEGVPVIMAAGADLELLELLLANGADINEKDLNAGGTALHESIGPCLSNYPRDGDVRLLRFLLAHGADMTTCDGAGNTPLDCAFEGRVEWEIQELMEAVLEKVDIYDENNELCEDASQILADSGYFGASCLNDADDLDADTTALIRQHTGIEICNEEEQEEAEEEDERDLFLSLIKAKPKLDPNDPQFVDKCSNIALEIFNEMFGYYMERYGEVDSSALSEVENWCYTYFQDEHETDTNSENNSGSETSDNDSAEDEDSNELNFSDTEEQETEDDDNPRYDSPSSDSSPPSSDDEKEAAKLFKKRKASVLEETDSDTVTVAAPPKRIKRDSTPPTAFFHQLSNAPEDKNSKLQTTSTQHEKKAKEKAMLRGISFIPQ